MEAVLPDHNLAPKFAGAVQLAMDVDAARIADEMHSVRSPDWRNQQLFADGRLGAVAEVDWKVLPMRNIGGDLRRSDPGGPSPEGFQWTSIAREMPYTCTKLQELGAPLNAVRFMALGTGVESDIHCDTKYALSRGMVRIHFPLTTLPEARLVLDGVEYCWQPGEAWMGEFSRPHAVWNRGQRPRVHLVIDALLTSELLSRCSEDWLATVPSDYLLTMSQPVASPRFRASRFGCRLPKALVDFERVEHDVDLDGPMEDFRLVIDEDGSGQLSGGAGAFRVEPLNTEEHRFSGWSVERTLRVLSATDLPSITLTVRSGGRYVSSRTFPCEPEPDV